MKKQANKSVLLMIMTVVIIGVSYFYIKTKQDVSTQDISTFTTYVSVDKDYTFKYPKSFFIWESTSKFVSIGDKKMAYPEDPAVQFKFGVFRYDKQQKETTSESLKYIESNGGNYKVRILDEKAITINGKPAYQILFTSISNINSSVIGVSTKSGFYTIFYQPANKKNTDINQSILSTFEFAK